MSLTPGTRLGPYEILSPLGAGGMGEVYRARDTKLDRDVAIKVLPEAFVADPERVSRFQREAKTLAALNHPNIATIHGLEEGEGVFAIVLELVDGPTLADRIAAGAVPVDEALAIARQMAVAIEAAHEQGIIHRDLKPANVKVRPNGTVKVLDFGLAKLQAGEAGEAGRAGRGSGGLTQSPTLTSPVATLAGTILGTAAYMAPEQARGKPVDKRADIWAFGCVLFEMLTGKRAFGGDEVSDTLAFIITKEMDWSALPASTPVALRRVLRRCLEKDPTKRLHDIADARIEIDDVMAKGDTADAPTASAVPAGAGGTPSRRSIPVIIAALASGALVGTLVWAITRDSAPPRLHPVRLGIVPSASQAFNGSPNARNIAISPDGTHIAYAGQVGLIVRALDQLDAALLDGTSGAQSPFFSPDGQWIGFFALGRLRKIAITGGPAIAICGVAAGPRGATWTANGTIVFATAAGGTLLSVAAAGGDPKPLTKLDQREFAHFYPSALPDGRAILYAAFTSGTTSPESGHIVALDLATGKQKTVLQGGSEPEYVPTGHLIYAAAGTLRAVRFDARRLEPIGDPFPVVDKVGMSAFGSANYAVSNTGTLVYVPGSVQGQPSSPRSLVWVDRQGREEPLAAPQRAYTLPRLSPDGTRVALDIRDQDSDIWVFDLARQTLERRTFDPGLDQYPVWSADSRRIFFAASRLGNPNVFAVSADGSGSAEPVTKPKDPQFPTSLSADGTRLILRDVDPATRFDVGMLTLSGNGQVEPLVHTPFSENNGEVSPDGHWLAYQSDESGRDEIHVRPFPNVDAGHWQISNSGGTRPLWARSGRELFFLDAANLLHVVTTSMSASFSAGNPVKLLSTAYFVAQGISGRSYDVSPDGRRFLMIKEPRVQPQSTAATPTIVLVLNWTEELKQRVPTR